MGLVNMQMCRRTSEFLGAASKTFERTKFFRERMAELILRRSSRLALTIASSGQEQEIALKCVISSSSFAKKLNGGKIKNVLKVIDAVGESYSEAGTSETSSEKWLCEEVSACAPLQQIKRPRLLKSLPSRNLEAELWEMCFQHIAGVDEAGSGPLAGPVVAAACINDSKKLSTVKREELYCKLTSTPGISFAATLQAIVGCVEKLRSAANGLSCPDYLLVDDNRLPEGFSREKTRGVVKVMILPQSTHDCQPALRKRLQKEERRYF